MATTIESTLPVINIAPLLGYLEADGELQMVSSDHPNLANAVKKVADEIEYACRNVGFFYITGHGVPSALISTLLDTSHQFFQQPLEIRERIDMNKVGGRAWRGYFRVGKELTSGLPDLKHGIYLGTHIEDEDHSQVKAKTPMFGPNLYPRSGSLLPDAQPQADGTYLPLDYQQTDNDRTLQQSIEVYLDHMKQVGYALADGISLSLGLDRDYLRQHFLKDPLCLFRIFNYPDPKPLEAKYATMGSVDEVVQTTNNNDDSSHHSSQPSANKQLFSVGEHTDYGLLTILYQDTSGGLQVRDVKSGEWMPAPPIADTFVVNIGDMLEKMTGGIYVSTPHRVYNPQPKDRISFPFFFDPDFSSEITTLVGLTPKLQNIPTHQGQYQRWDGKPIGLSDVQGTYGEYILQKVSKVFPQLAQEQISPTSTDDITVNK